MRRAIDFTTGVLALAVLSPLLAIIALGVAIDSPGNPFYGGWRVGQGGRNFRMWKFRTMVQGAGKMSPITGGKDPRITRVGRFLRKTKLDELPQILNILVGEMSFVGPRPEVPYYVEMFTEEEKAILTVRPGMTDWASLWNVDEGAVLARGADPEKTYAEGRLYE